MFLLQTFINEDYVVRKYVLVFPIMLYLLYAVLVTNSFKKIEQFFKERKVRNLVYSVLCFVVCVGIIFYRLFYISNGTTFDFSSIDKIVVLFQIFILILIENFVFWICLKDGINMSIVMRMMTWAVVIGCIVPNVFLNFKYIYLNNSYTEKELMQDVGKYADGEFVYGIYSISFTLYNDIKPIVNFYDNMGTQIVEYGDCWYLDYSNFMFPSEVMNEKVSVWKEEAVFEREFSTFGKKRFASLYKIEPKSKQK